jgi:acyl-CoA synthetase (NDP forming)
MGRALSMSICPIASLLPLFQPRHVAVIGASRSEGKPGHAVVRNLIRCGFSGRITPVNAAGGEIDGLACVTSLALVEGPIDCVMVVVPASGAVAAVAECAAQGVRSVIVGASGFAETNTDQGRAWQDALTTIARGAGMRLLGPNTNGIYNATEAVSIGYNAAHADVANPSTISVVSHSGALFGGVLGTLRALGSGLSKFIPVGNEADIDMLDVVDFLIEDPATRVIGLVIEAISDGHRLRAAALRARAAGKPMVALKVGRSQLGAGAALAHSSRLAGSARAYDALFRAGGIASVQSVEALAGGCAVLAASDAPLAPGDRRLVAVTTSGAGGALLADAAFPRAIPLAGSATGEWDGAAGAAIAALPARGWLRNPIDMGSLDTWAQLNEVYAALEQDGLCGPTAVYAHIAPSPAMDRQLVAAVAARRNRVAAPIVLVAPGGLTADIEADYRKHGIPVFHDSLTCLDSLACHYQTRTAQDAPDTAPAPKAEISALLAAGRGQEFLSELASAAILREAGVSMVPSQEISNADQAALAAQSVGYPVVLKALVPGIAHKHDAGLVQIGLATEAGLRLAFNTLLANITKAGASPAEASFVLQPMLKGRVELILGVSQEASLGHFLVIGLGGVNTELLDQVVLLPVPSTRGAIMETLAPTPLGRLLRKLAGGSDALLVDVINNALAVQALVSSAPAQIRSVDINPLLVTANGCQAVDALIVLAEAAP